MNLLPRDVNAIPTSLQTPSSVGRTGCATLLPEQRCRLGHDNKQKRVLNDRQILTIYLLVSKYLISPPWCKLLPPSPPCLLHTSMTYLVPVIRADSHRYLTRGEMLTGTSHAINLAIANHYVLFLAVSHLFLWRFAYRWRDRQKKRVPATLINEWLERVCVCVVVHCYL